MGIIHIVMFQFKPLATAEEVEKVCARMLALKDNCIHPKSGKPYIKVGMGGINNSPEGLQGSITHSFISEFENEEDRKYYLSEDPVHLQFVGELQGIVEKVQVIDFSPGVF